MDLYIGQYISQRIFSLFTGLKLTKECGIFKTLIFRYFSKQAEIYMTIMGQIIVIVPYLMAIFKAEIEMECI